MTEGLVTLLDLLYQARQLTMQHLTLALVLDLQLLNLTHQLRVLQILHVFQLHLHLLLRLPLQDLNLLWLCGYDALLLG